MRSKSRILGALLPANETKDRGRATGCGLSVCIKKKMDLGLLALLVWVGMSLFLRHGLDKLFGSDTQSGNSDNLPPTPGVRIFTLRTSNNEQGSLDCYRRTSLLAGHLRPLVGEYFRENMSFDIRRGRFDPGTAIWAARSINTRSTKSWECAATISV